MTRLTTLAALLAVSTGCIFVDRDHRPVPNDVVVAPDVVVNAPPTIFSAEAGCFFDEFNNDDIWYFDAVVDDLDGPLDVVEVWADVYDEQTGYLIESFPLDPTNDVTYWTSEWFASTTLLDCWYPLYVVDVIAYDSFDDFDLVSIYPDTYR